MSNKELNILCVGEDLNLAKDIGRSLARLMGAVTVTAASNRLAAERRLRKEVFSICVVGNPQNGSFLREQVEVVVVSNNKGDLALAEGMGMIGIRPDEVDELTSVLKNR